MTRDLGVTFFYHFASERKDHCGPYHAFRAILVQLVHKFRSDKDVVDKIAILMDTESSGQLTASNEEVWAALLLFFAQIPHIVLVFDAIDECEDCTTFLELVREVCMSNSVRVLLLSRPNIDVPTRFQSLSLHLQSSSNIQDIKLFLGSQIVLLQERELIPNEISVRAAVETLALRAEGMFLWAWLMSRYLQCRALSPRERLDTIFETSIVEGLDDVYNKIIVALSRGYDQEKFKVQRMFELIAVAIRPFSVTELQTALAISPGKTTKNLDLIVAFEESIPIMSGALVEVQQDRTVRFIHSSLRDFLITNPNGANKGNFKIDEDKANILSSIMCLSYIINDLPASPLHGRVAKVDPDGLRASFPLIQYSFFWVRHAAIGLHLRKFNQDQLLPSIYDKFCALVTDFVNRPLTITVWIEASVSFGQTPLLLPLKELYEQQTLLPSNNCILSTLTLTMTLLKDLAVELERLNSEWGYLLKKDPSEIWGPSISAFCKSQFWYTTDDTTVSSMLSTETVDLFPGCKVQQSILLRSQGSSSGDKIGIAMVIPSR